jgi:hypothetical protein
MAATVFLIGSAGLAFRIGISEAFLKDASSLEIV